MTFPDEKKRPTCRHDPKQWTDCPRCVEDYYLELLAASERHPGPHPFAELRALVEIRPHGSAPVFVARGKTFSVKMEWAQGASAEEALERVILDTLSALEAEKAALELKSAMLEAELERTKAALLASEYEAEQKDTSWRLACADRQRELEARQTLRKNILMREGTPAATAALIAEKELPRYPAPEAPSPPWAARHPELGPSMLSALRNATTRADTAEAEERRLREVKDEIYAERNELAALLTQLALAHELPAGRGVDFTAEEGFQTLLFVQLSTGQVSWHLPDHERPLADGLPTFQAPWDGHTTLEKRRRIRAAIFAGFSPPRGNRS